MSNPNFRKFYISALAAAVISLGFQSCGYRSEVKNARQIEQAAEMIRSTDGVKSVNNQLTAKAK